MKISNPSNDRKGCETQVGVCEGILEGRNSDQGTLGSQMAKKWHQEVAESLETARKSEERLREAPFKCFKLR